MKRTNNTIDFAYCQLKNGEVAGMAGIFQKYYRRMFWHGRGILWDDFAVECIVQDAFVRLWVCRDQINDPDHIFYFLRHVVSQECLGCLRANKYWFYRRQNYLGDYEGYEDYLCGVDPEEVAQDKDLAHLQEELYKQVEDVLPYLSSSRRKMLRLCLEHGFRYKPISRLLGMSFQTVCREVQHAIEDLKHIIERSQKLNATRREKPVVKISFEGELSEEQQEILRLRYENKYSFDKIAGEMGLPQSQVQKQFVVAYKLVRKMDKVARRLV